MAPKGIEIVTTLLVVAVVATVATAQSGCSNVLISMASCLSYVSGSNPTPSPSCCSALANVVKTQPRCLCTIVNGGGGSVGMNINQTLALELPSKCQVQTPPVSDCDVVNGPVGSPETAPSPNGYASSPTSPSVAGSKTVPQSGTTLKKIDVLQYVVGFLVLIITASASASYAPILDIFGV